jgi:pyruvate/2-oxoglutarate dehydrogenase complex dihydrolipoamide acyltransferase (E2) component
MAIIEIRVDDPGQSEEIEIVRMLVEDGDEVEEGDVVAEVATDKANADVVAPASGTIRGTPVAEGSFVEPDAVLIRLETN